MKCPHCNQEHPEKFNFCPITGKNLKWPCPNPDCSVFGEYLFPLEQESCPICGTRFIKKNDGHEFVDLGLSVKWATCNVGASSPKEYGSYFAWGETCPKSNYSSRSLKYGGDITNSIDEKMCLVLSNDAASANWGSSWRMPTYEEQDELRHMCIWTWESEVGHNGYKITSKRNGNSIFLPATGFKDGINLCMEDYSGSYWSSSLRARDCENAFFLHFDPHGISRNNTSRSAGKCVRPVCP